MSVISCDKQDAFIFIFIYHFDDQIIVCIFDYSQSKKNIFFTFVMFQKFRQFDPKQHQIAENNFFKTSEMSEVTLAVSKKEAEP